MQKILNLPMAAYGLANDNQIPIRFSQELPAPAARYNRFIRIRGHCNCDEISFACGDGSPDRDSFGTNRQTKRSVLNIGAHNHGLRPAFERRADSEF